MELYPDLFEGVSTIQGAKVKLDIDPNVPSVVQPPRKIPSAMVEPLKKEIDHMLSLGVIQKLLGTMYPNSLTQVQPLI